eukprot:TRINITY_DN704_c0_g1_i17.p1 TRINITY_DN704_c0_g1~~TRINITY_DN704_c0_g1_i17.p1  ORF type:complete len:129 (-),score=10.08 TRINITY_DN704_c0_g1_i17:466-852(-)
MKRERERGRERGRVHTDSGSFTAEDIDTLSFAITFRGRTSHTPADNKLILGDLGTRIHDNTTDSLGTSDTKVLVAGTSVTREATNHIHLGGIKMARGALERVLDGGDLFRLLGPRVALAAGEGRLASL